MPIDAVALRDQLQGTGFAEPNAALAFGDVLAARNRRSGLRRWVYRAANLLAVMSPGLKVVRGQTAEVVLVAAGHDPRSVERLRLLEAAIRSSGRSVVLWRIGRDDDIPGFDLAGARCCPAMSPREALRGTLGVMRAGRPNSRVGERLEILRWLLVQAARTEYFVRVLRVADIALVISDYDRGLAAAPVILAARQCGIPTMTLLHGDPNRVGYTPFLADNVSTWNSAQREALSRWDPNAHLLTPVGAHWVRESESVRGDPASAHVLLAHSGDGGFTSFVQSLADVAKRHQSGGAAIRFRPHPLTSEEERRIVRREWPVSSEDAATDLGWADLVYCDQSTFALDAITAGCVVRVRGGEGLASIQGLGREKLKPLPDGWAELPARSGDWPHLLLGEAALNALVLQIHGWLSPGGHPEGSS